jgi:hypothetical protein
VATQGLLVDSEQTRCLLKGQAQAINECAFKQFGNLDHNRHRSTMYEISRQSVCCQESRRGDAFTGIGGTPAVNIEPDCYDGPPKDWRLREEAVGGPAQEGIWERSIQAQEYVKSALRSEFAQRHTSGFIAKKGPPIARPALQRDGAPPSWCTIRPTQWDGLGRRLQAGIRGRARLCSCRQTRCI